MASQLLNTHSYIGQTGPGLSSDAAVLSSSAPQLGTLSFQGIGITASLAFALASLVHWVRGGRPSAVGFGRLIVFLVILVLLAMILYAYMRRQWLQYLRQQTLVGISEFVTKAQDLDSSAMGALTLIQEVELVSRGYRM